MDYCGIRRLGSIPENPHQGACYIAGMTRFTFNHADEILLRLSDSADDERVRSLATSDPGARLDGFIRDLEATQRDIVALLRQKIARRSPGAAS
jgi:hypothetical protein